MCQQVRGKVVNGERKFDPILGFCAMARREPSVVDEGINPVIRIEELRGKGTNGGLRCEVRLMKSDIAVERSRVSDECVTARLVSPNNRNSRPLRSEVSRSDATDTTRPARQYHDALGVRAGSHVWSRFQTTDL